MSRQTFPVLLTLHLASNDQAIRDHIRMEQPLPSVPLQRVICQDSAYSDMIYARWVNLKIARTGRCGGGWHERYVRNGKL